METDVRSLRASPLVLVVLDQPVLAEVVRLALVHGRLRTVVARSVEDAMTALTARQPHLVIVNADVGNGAAFGWLDETTVRDDRLPLLALTRRGDLETKLAAFEWGVDDIVTVPFSPEELLARVLAIMRRTYGEAAVFTPVIRFGELEIDILHRRVRAGKSELHLTALEQGLLYLLAANAGRLLTRDEILDHLWGVDYAAESNVVDRHIRNLRAKLEDDWRRPRFITTVPGKGYRFAPTGEDPSVAPPT
jgi:DNA-binding response OmpR family regulator